MATMASTLVQQSPVIAIDMSFDSSNTTSDGADAGASATVPELRDPDYVTAVLQLPQGRTESQIHDDLIAKANALGISTEAATSKRITSSVESASTVYNARTFSMLSGGSTSTALTAHSSLFAPTTPDLRVASVRESKDLSFAQYDRYLSILDPHHNPNKFLREPPQPDPTAQSVFSGKTKRSLFSVKSGLKNRIRWRRKTPQPLEVMMTCHQCRADFKTSTSLHNIPCGHTYCADCLESVVTQAMADESNMPPRCCDQPLSATVIKDLLSRESQQDFLKAIVQYGTPWQARIFCPNTSCGEFIPPHHNFDHKHPFNVTCRKCSTRVCLTCKRSAHPTGKNCPEDWELDHLIKLGGKDGARRCYKCGNLVEMAAGSTQMKCRCEAEFCSICGGAWDLRTGCPNSCDIEEELERRRKEEEVQLAQYEEEKATQEAAAAMASAERLEAEERTKCRNEFRDLGEAQAEELRRFLDFAAKTKESMHARHARQREATAEKQDEQGEKMKERHARTVAHLEDRQVAAEMDLRSTLEQSERSVKIRLKHMEAYCDGLGRGSGSGPGTLPPRVVTERDLRELGQQYNVRDGMDRLHQAKINVMRDRQAKRMEELVDRQESELEKFTDKGLQDREDLTRQAAQDDETYASKFASRKAKLVRRWELSIEVLRKELEAQDGLKYAPIPTPVWPEEADK
ncbi:hypothetical protein B0J13DRAFT_186791 [Dactylonectria estremocensis]|uniref:RBR-type E3 ubiquitin transferase n=1 Tax=Dactylonectria estremocensis TaxID=1079267 RepID=A0A9P9FCV3_9HYPO|nr:hypothetical protein B0J13DRAFT_186791 [Dactylonectria estremocensis]